MKTKIATSLALLPVLVSLTGCGIDGVISETLSGGSSMRIEVEVYKGALSKNIDVQWGELNAAIKETQTSLATFDDELLRIASIQGYLSKQSTSSDPAMKVRPHHRGRCSDQPPDTEHCPPYETNESETGKNKWEKPSRTVTHIWNKEVKIHAEAKLFWCDAGRFQNAWNGSMPGWSSVGEGSGCLRLAQLHDEVGHLHRILYTIRKLSEEKAVSSPQAKGTVKNLREIVRSKDLIKYLTLASEVGARMKVKAFQWAMYMRVVPEDRITRTLITSFAAAAAEMGNQISTRADTILKQCPAILEGGDIRKCNDFIARGLPLSVYLRDTNPTEFLNLFTYNRSGGFATWEETLTRPIWTLGVEESTDRARVVESLFADHNWSNINTVYASGQGDVRMAFVKDEIGNWNLKNFKNDPTELLDGYVRITGAAIKTAIDLAGSKGTMDTALSLAGNMMKGRVSPKTNSAAGVNLQRLSTSVSSQIDEITSNAKQEANNVPTDADGREKTLKEIYDRAKAKIESLLNYHDKTLESLEAAIVGSEEAENKPVVNNALVQEAPNLTGER